jgi:hypothetical protein
MRKILIKLLGLDVPFTQIKIELNELHRRLDFIQEQFKKNNMKHNIIKTENYLLVVDDSKIKGDDIVLVNNEYHTNDIRKFTTALGGKSEWCKKIIAHLPLNNSPVLEGLPLLPPLEDEVERLVKEHWEKGKELNNPSSFKSGHNKAKEKYKYTEEDMCNFIEFVRDNYTGFGTPNLIYNKGKQENTKKIFERYKSLQKTKLPVAFDCEVERYTVGEMSSLPLGTVNQRLKTTTNSQGITQWVGSYIYE